MGIPAERPGDIWALGCLLYELLMEQYLFPVFDQDPNYHINMFHAVGERLNIKLKDEIIEKRRLLYIHSGKCSGSTRGLEFYKTAVEGKYGKDPRCEPFIKLLCQMLDIVPENRKSAAELLKDPFFTHFSGILINTVGNKKEIDMRIISDTGECLLLANLSRLHPCYHIRKSDKPYQLIFFENGRILNQKQINIENDREIISIDTDSLRGRQEITFRAV